MNILNEMSNKKQKFNITNYNCGAKARFERNKNKSNARVNAIALKSNLLKHNPAAARYFEQRGFDIHRMPMRTAKTYPSGTLNRYYAIALIRQQQEEAEKSARFSQAALRLKSSAHS